jgi:hypothetical protein
MGEIGFGGNGAGDGKPAKKKRARRGKAVAALKPRKAKVLAGILDGKSPRRAALEAGYSEHMADNANAKILTPDFRRTLVNEMERQGITDELLVERIKEGISSERVELAKYEGRISDERVYPDMEQRGRYVDRALELKGYIKRDPAAQVNMPIMLVHSIPRPNYGNGPDKNGD